MIPKSVATSAMTILLAVYIGGAAVHAQTSAAPIKKTPPSKVAPGKTEEKKSPPAVAEPTPPPEQPFQPIFFSADGVSPNEYSKNDAFKVVAWFEGQMALVPGKIDQFSTREERESRERALNEKMSGIGALPFVTNCEKKYNAEAQAFEIVHPTHKFNKAIIVVDPESLELRGLSVGRRVVSKDTYLAENAYGAKTEVIREVIERIALAYPGNAENEPASIVNAGSPVTSIKLPYLLRFVWYKFKVPMPSTEAREVDKEMACLWVFRLAPPYFFTFNEHYLPKRDTPFDSKVSGKALFGKLEQLVVFNKATGTVYSRFAAGK